MINQKSQNRYCVLVDENDGTRTGYYFSAPVYNIYSGDVVNLKFEQVENNIRANGSNAVINISDRIHLSNAQNSCSLVIDQSIIGVTEMEVHYKRAILRPTLNGVTCQFFVDGYSEISINLQLEKIMGFIRANNKCFAVMCQKFRPFVTVSCLGTLDKCGNIIAPVSIAHKKLDELTYRLTFTPHYASGTSIMFEINLYEDKLFQDTTVDSLDPQSNNALGGTAFLGYTSLFGQQWLYSRLDFSKMPELRNKKINYSKLYLPLLNRSNIELAMLRVSSRFCSFGSTWNNRIAASRYISCSRPIENCYHLDTTELLCDAETGYIQLSEGVILRNQNPQSDPITITTGDSHYAPQILEVNYQ